MYPFNYSVRLLKIGGSGRQLKLSLGRETIEYLRLKPGDTIRWWLYRDRHFILRRSDGETVDEQLLTAEPSPPMGRVSRVEIRASYKRCTIPSVFAKLLNLTYQDYLGCRPIQDYGLHAWPVTKHDLIALDPLYTREGTKT